MNFDKSFHVVAGLLFAGALITQPAVMAAPSDNSQSTSTSGQPAGQPGQGQHQGGAKRGERFIKAVRQLDLTAEQKQKLDDILKNSTPGPQRHDQIMAILTDAQKTQLHQILQQEHGAAGGHGGAGGGAGKPPAETQN